MNKKRKNSSKSLAQKRKRIRNRVSKTTQRSRHLFFNKKMDLFPTGVHFVI